MESSWWTDPKELDNDQKKVVALSTAEDHVVVGPPGCGKTNLLLLRENSSQPARHTTHSPVIRFKPTYGGARNYCVQMGWISK
jgi:hypothetical protein